MITNKQITDAAIEFSKNSDHGHYLGLGFSCGAGWAIERLNPDYDALHAENSRLKSENIFLKSESTGLFRQIAAYEASDSRLQAENARLRKALQSILRIAERGDGNIQPLLSPIKAKASVALLIDNAQP